MYAQINPIRVALAANSGPTEWVPLFSGPYPDFTEQWFAVVGAQIIVTVVLNMLLPLFPLILEVLKAFCCVSTSSDEMPGILHDKSKGRQVKGEFGLAERYGVSYNSGYL